MKKILKHLGEDWYKYVLELIVITAGILGAYALNNWNEERKAAIEEQEILKQLYDDFQNSKIQSEKLIADESQDIWKLNAALGAQEQVDSLFNLPDKQVIANRIFWGYRSGVPVFRGYIDMKNSGKSSLIQNTDLRSELSNLEESINELKLMIDDRSNVHNIRLDAMAVEDLNFLPLISEENPNRADGVTSDYAKLMSQQKIRNLIGIKLQLANSVLNAREELDAQINEVLAAIKKEIE